MPLYEYECAACGETFEELVSLRAQNPPCPKCRNEKTERKFSVPAKSGGSCGSGRSGFT